MTYVGENGSAPGWRKIWRSRTLNWWQSAKDLYMEGSKVVTTFAYNGKKGCLYRSCDGGDFTSKVE